MADAVAVDIAKQLTAFIAAQPYATAFTPVRSYADFDLRLEDDGVIHCDVVGVSTKQTIDLGSRGQLVSDVPCDIALRKKFTDGDADPATGKPSLAAIDAMMLLAETIATSLVPQRLNGLGGVWKETEILSFPVLKHIREQAQFTSIIRVTFTAYTDV
jgi:hypothetical protein